MIVAYDLGGPSRGQVPAPLTVEWVDRDGDLPTLRLSYSEHAPRYAELAGAVEIAYLVPDGKDWVEPPNARMVVADDSNERLKDRSKVHAYDFAGLASEFAYHHLTEGAGAERTFTSVTAGALISTFVDEVQAAGGLPWLELGFTADTDSRGEAWPYYLEDGTPQGTQVHTATIPLRTKDLLTFLQELPRAQWWMQGRTLHLAPWKPGTTNPIHLPDVLMAESPEKRRHASARSHIRVVGDEGKSWLFPIPGANRAYGKRVGVVQAQGVTDEASARMVAETHFPEAVDAAESFTRQWRVTDGTPWLPGKDIQVRDWITTDTDEGKRRPARVAGMSIQEGKGGRSAFVTLGTIQDGLLLKLAKAQRSTAGGVGVMNGTPKPPTPPSAAIQWPEAPTGLQVTAGTWTAADGTPQGHLSASWQATTVDTDRNPVTVDRYQLRARRTSNPATTFQDIAAPKETTATVTRTDMKAGETWEIIVAAVTEPRTGPFSAPVSVTVQQDQDPPEQPSAPGLSSTPATLTATWDGLDMRGSAMAPDTVAVILQLEGVAQTWTMEGATRQVRIPAGPGEPIAVAGVYRARLQARDQAGNLSPWSAWSGHVTVKSAVQWPASPAGLVVEADTYTTSEGGYRGVIAATWAAVTVDTSGQPVEIKSYPVRVRRTGGEFPVDWMDLFSSAGLSGSGSSELMQVGDVWEVAVAATSTDGHTGPFSTPPVTVTIPPDTDPPNVPSAPTVTSARGMLTVRWGQKTATGGAMPPDLSHIRVVLDGQAETWVMDPLVGVIHIPATDAGTVRVGTAYTARLVAVDHAGNESNPSNPTGPVTVVSAITGLQQQINQVETDFADADRALSQRIDTIEVGGAYWGATTPMPPAAGFTVGQTWYDTGTRTIKVWNGSAWGVHQVGNEQIWAIDAAKITTGILDANRVRADAAWFQSKVLIGSSEEVYPDPSWQVGDLNTSRTRTGWTVAPGVVTHTRKVTESFYLGLLSSWSATDAKSWLPLKAGVRYRVTATVKLNAAGTAGVGWQTTAGSGWTVGGESRSLGTTAYTFTGEYTWGTSPGAFRVEMSQPGTITNVSVRPMVSQVLIQDGLISTPQLAVGAVDADRIAVGAVNADKLTVDAIDYMEAWGLKLVSAIVTTTGVPDRGIWLNGTDNTLKAFSSTGQETFKVDGATGDVSMSGIYRTRGAYPQFEINRALWVSFAGMQWIVAPDWAQHPELTVSSATWGPDLAGSMYLRGGQRYGLTMRPLIALASGRKVNNVDQFWPTIDIALEDQAGNSHGVIQLQDIGENKTKIRQWTDFFRTETKDGSGIEFPIPGTPGDMELWAKGAITFIPGNGWFRFFNLGTTTGGMDLRLESDARVTVMSSQSRFKLAQDDVPPIPQLLALQPRTWVDRTMADLYPGYAIRTPGLVVEQVEQVLAAMPEEHRQYAATLVREFDQGQGPVKTVTYPQGWTLLLPLIRALWVQAFGPIPGIPA